MAGKGRRFFAEAGAIGVCGFVITLALLVISLVEHHTGHTLRALYLFVGACCSFCFGCFVAWSKADDRANERKPQLGFSADREGFYLKHLQGDAVRFIKIEPIGKPNGTKLHFDSVDFLREGDRKELVFRLEISQAERTANMEKIIGIIFSGWTTSYAEYPVVIRFQWNEEELKDRVILSGSPQKSDSRLGRGEFFVLQYGSFNELHQRIAKQVRVGTIVKPERHFIKVGGKMLCRDFMPRTNDAALTRRKRIRCRSS